MKNFKLFAVVITLLVISSCSGDKVLSVKYVPGLISEGFRSDTEYEIVCIGIPKDGLNGIQKEESAKRAALLTAYYFAGNKFDNTVKPEQDGDTENFTMFNDHGELKYVITKSDLKKRIKN